MIFFTNNPNIIFFWGDEGVAGWRGVGGGGRWVGGGVDGWTDIQTQTDLPFWVGVGFVVGWEGLD